MKNIIKIIGFLLLVIIILVLLGPVLTPFWNTNYVLQGINKEDKNTIDVLFVGNSDIYAGISPMEIYEKFGITSYTYGSTDITPKTEYYLMKEALKRQNAKLVVMDASSIYNDIASISSLHRAMDSFPFSKNKMDFINDKGYHLSNYEKLEMVLPFFKFHSRFDEISSFDFRKNKLIKRSITKGYDLSKEINPSINYKLYMKKSNDDIQYKNNDVAESVIKAKDYCDKNDIEFLLISMPDTKAWNYAKSSHLTKWAKDNNIDYMDLNISKTKIDFNHDSRDGGEHLNMYGGTKLSNYLGKYINDKYKLDNHKDDSKYDNWNKDLIEYNNLKKQL